MEKSVEGFVRLSTDGTIMEANEAAAALFGFPSVDALIKAMGPFLQHASIEVPQELIELISKVRAPGFSVDTTIGVLTTQPNQRVNVRARFEWLDALADQSASHLISLKQPGTEYHDQHAGVSADSAHPARPAAQNFLTSVNREIRTPLNSFTGVLKLLGNTDLSVEQGRYLNIAEVSAQSLLTVVDDLLELAKVDAGDLELKSEPFSFHEMLLNRMEQIAPRAINKNIELKSTVQSTVPDDLIGDKDKVGRLLNTILENAVKFTETGTVELSVKCDSINNMVANIQIFVRDTGHGMSEEATQGLMDLFSGRIPVSSSSKDYARLGLTLCHRHLSLMDGVINLHSELGHGSEFMVTLPMQLEAPHKQDSKLVRLHMTGKRVLIVDDHKINLEYLHELFESVGMVPDSAFSGSEAVKKTLLAARTDAPYDVIALDYCLSDMNGLEMVQQLSAVDKEHRPRLIILSTIDQVIKKSDYDHLGISAVLTKPVRSVNVYDSLLSIYAGSPLVSADTNVTIYTADTNPPATTTELSNKNSEGKQTVSYLTIPEQAILFDQANARYDSGNQATSSDQNSSSPCVLIVEDNPVNLLVAEETLLDAHYRVEVASNGEEALDRLDQTGIDLVLMDCQMPVLDGFAATRRIRTMEREQGVLVPQQLPIVALTADVCKGDREKCLAAGMNDYIAKPFQPDTLFSVLNQYIQRPATNDEELDDRRATGT